MSKFKLLLATLLLFGTFTTIQASELARLCGFESPNFGPNPICQAEGIITYFGGPNCNNEIFMSIYFVNLNGFNNQPYTGVNYNLPPEMPVLYAQLDLDDDGNYETTLDPIDGFQYNGYKIASSAAQGFHYFFEHKIDLSPYFINFNSCPSGGNKNIHARLMQGLDADLALFDPLPFGGTFDIISCEAFHETCSLCLDREGNPIAPNCTASASIPEYDLTVCLDCTTDCSLERGTILNNQIEETKFAPLISPNPFLEEVVVEFETQKENAPTEIEIYDWTGALILKKTYATEIGKRKITLEMASLPQGVYYLNLLVDELRTTSKIVKL